MTTHTVKFEKKRDDIQAPQFGLGKHALYRAHCTCGWFDVDRDLNALQARAGSHDIAWEEVKPTENQND